MQDAEGVRDFRVAQGAQSNECKACERILCAHCGEQKNTSLFDAKYVDSFFTNSQSVVCLVCAASGATPSSGRYKAEKKDGKTCEKCSLQKGVRDFRVAQGAQSNECKACERILCAHCGDCRVYESDASDYQPW